MASEPVGRQVQVMSKFQRAAIVPGGVDRQGAQQAADKTVAAMQDAVHRQLRDNLDPLVLHLREWHSMTRAEMPAVCGWAATTRDLAGLANQHLLTEVAMYAYDSLDAVTVDGVRMDAVEAACFADALEFAQRDLCRGSDLKQYQPLLKDLQTLTALVVGRIAKAS